jgi:dihydroorotase
VTANGEKRATGKVAYVNARLLDPASELDAPGGLLTVGEAIAEFGPRLFAGGQFEVGIPDDAQVIDCKGACLAPGLIDIRVQLRDPGEEHKETIQSGSRAAAAGGVTAMVCLPNTDPPIDDVSVLEFIARRAREVKLVKVYAYGALTRGLEGREITEIGLMAEAGALGFTDGVKATTDATVMRRALSYASAFGKPIIQHPEEPSLAAGGEMNEGEIAMRLGLKGIPAVAETIMVERDLRLVELTGGRYHAAHLSTAGAIQRIREAKADGLPVTCDTAPHYFALNEMAVGDYRTFAKVSPPLRAEVDRRAVVEGIKDGTIDVIASDHAPQDQDSKRLPFTQAEFGVVGLETLLPISLELVHNAHMSLIEVLARLTCRPADLLGLRSGRLAKGGPADLVLFDPDRPWRIEDGELNSKSKNSAFDGRPVQGRVLRTVVDGRTVYTLDG